ncbi:lysozyme inhibitor LprI family protein [Pantoea stewartii]|uniref:lysozyme inhibitor LprI family protein n=1 Tax=Pantoea stewartii TaxID=66269 RepID=UPI0019804DAB|nr:lysozyme inhibitor LprI family protein [Pantoea stewartii]
MKKILLSTLLIVGMQVLNPVYALSDCSQGNNDQEVYSCAEKNKSETEVMLNKEYKAAKSRVQELYKGNDEELNKYISTLTEAQRAWLKYRENDCELASFAADKGSDASLSYINICLYEHNEQRIKKLKMIPYH